MKSTDHEYRESIILAFAKQTCTNTKDIASVFYMSIPAITASFTDLFEKKTHYNTINVVNKRQWEKARVVFSLFKSQSWFCFLVKWLLRYRHCQASKKNFILLSDGKHGVVWDYHWGSRDISSCLQVPNPTESSYPASNKSE